MFNVDIKHGFLCEDAQVFPSRTGKPKICFRMMVPRAPEWPKKQPVNADFFSVVLYGDRHLDLLPDLTTGREVMIIGITQSRDLEDGSVITEILAREIIIFPDEAAQRIALAQFLVKELETERQLRGNPQWSPNDLERWIVEKLQARDALTPSGSTELAEVGSIEETPGESKSNGN